MLTVPLSNAHNQFDFKRVSGGLLVQTPDALNVQASQLKVVTKVQPTKEQLTDLLFAWRVAKYVKSNAIVFCKDGQTLGVGAGQMSRVDSARASPASRRRMQGLSLAGSVVSSDAFFPFRDGIDVLATAGAKAVIQPGGSMRDEEVIAAADEHGLGDGVHRLPPFPPLNIRSAPCGYRVAGRTSRINRRAIGRLRKDCYPPYVRLK